MRIFYFSDQRSFNWFCGSVLLLDELDLLVTRKQNVLYDFFDWPRYKHSGLIVVGIANHMDLDSHLKAKIGSRLGSYYSSLMQSHTLYHTITVTRFWNIQMNEIFSLFYCLLTGLNKIAFNSYTASQLENILRSRLHGNEELENLFDQHSIKLIASTSAKYFI
jgi:Cdc6-like AAA superfamily ATPase